MAASRPPAEPRVRLRPVAPAQEIELKLAVPASVRDALRARLAALGRGTRQRLDTTYYDTADLLLARHGMALRLRRAGSRWWQTLKTGAAQRAFSVRGEWETAVPGGRLQPARLRDSPLPALLAAHGRPRLQPLFSTRFVREVRLVSVGKSQVEVALDLGEIVAGRGRTARRLPLSELELELKGGKPRALFRLARALMAGEDGPPLPLVAFTESKAARGHRLHAGAPAQPLKASAKGFVAALRAGQSADHALRRVIGHGVEVLLANAQGIGIAATAAADPEFVHQARVALRRMRSTVRLWRKHSRFPRRLADELRWIGRALGAARDADVLVTQTLPQLRASLPPGHEQALAALVAAAQARREAAADAARDVLASARFARLALDVLAWAHDAGDNESAPLRKLAPRQLARALARLRDAARFFAALSPARRHAVRILAKRLRYALDLYAVALPAAPAAAYLDRLSHLQDLLGELNDTAVAHATLGDLGAPAALRAALAASLVAREAAAVRAAEAALDALFALPPPWT